MKYKTAFNDFLSKHVNLNPSRLKILEKKVQTITTLLKRELPGYRKYRSQGSYAHRTIIKPVKDNNKFDADIMVFIKDDNFKTYRLIYAFTDYIDMVYDVLKRHKNYADKIRKKTRCVTIDYAGHFQLDIVPCIEDNDIYHNHVYYICNRNNKTYEKTDGDGYKKWLVETNRIVGGDNFIKSIRLFKYLRDSKSNFTVKSILLTTILGNQVRKSNDFFENNVWTQIRELDDHSQGFSDLPETLKTLSNKVNFFLKNNISMPTIRNPILPSEHFNRHWNHEKYTYFKGQFDIYNSRINEAYEEEDPNESIKKWRELFGDGFGRK